MTDEELAAIVAQLAATKMRTTEGVQAIFTLAAKLTGEPEFAGPVRYIPGAGGSHSFSTEFVAQRMLNITRDSGSPMAAIAWLRKISSQTRANGGAVKALYGVTCTGRVKLSNTVVLLPLSELAPSSATARWIQEEHERAAELSGLIGFKAAPTAALYRAGILEPLFCTPVDIFTSPAIAWFAELDEAESLLALTAKAIPSEAARWLQMDDPDVAMLVEAGISRHGSSGDLPLPDFYQSVEVTTDSATGLVGAFRNLSESDKNKVRLSIERIGRSRCQRHSGNRAIDLAIAFEVLFMGDQGEHRYKISLRAARLLRDAQTERRTVFAEVKALYDMRSGMVHTGSCDDEFHIDGAKRAAYDLVERADVLCTEALRKILTRGGIPKDWRDVELT